MGRRSQARRPLAQEAALRPSASASDPLFVCAAPRAVALRDLSTPTPTLPPQDGDPRSPAVDRIRASHLPTRPETAACPNALAVCRTSLRARVSSVSLAGMMVSRGTGRRLNRAHARALSLQQGHDRQGPRP